MPPICERDELDFQQWQALTVRLTDNLLTLLYQEVVAFCGISS